MLTPATQPNATHRRAGVGVVTGLVLLVALASFLRIQLALGDPNFASSPVEGLLKSDPALIHYLTERVVDAGGGLPADYRTDPRIEYPETVDIPAIYTVGQEFPVAWLYLALGGNVPLHRVSLWFMGIWASLTVLGVWGLTRELTASRGLAFLAALVWITLPATWRTAGLVHMREDFALPFFAAHLWLFARAIRRPSPATCLGLGLAILCALATWHAMGLVLALEGALLVAWTLRSGRSPLAKPVTWLAPVVPLAGAAVIPVLATRQGWASPALACLVAVWAAGLVTVLRGERRHVRSVVIGTLVGILVLGALGSPGADMAHTWELLLAKARFLGQLPADPTRLSPTVRLMWQGPFETANLAVLWGGLGTLLVAFPVLIPRARRAWRGGAGLEEREGLLATLALASLVAAWAVQRLMFLPALLGVPAILLAASRASRAWKFAALLLLAVQTALFLGFFTFNPTMRGRVQWYAFEARQSEIAHMVHAVEEHLPAGAPLAADFVNSAAVLAYGRRPILFQPKWETARSRERIVEFLATFFEGTPEDLRRLLINRYGCHHLLVDRFTLWYLARYAGGHRWSDQEPRPGTAAAALLSREADVLEEIPGYELLWRSPAFILQSNGRPTDFYRLYRLDD